MTVALQAPGVQKEESGQKDGDVKSLGGSSWQIKANWEPFKKSSPARVSLEDSAHALACSTAASGEGPADCYSALGQQAAYNSSQSRVA